MPFVPNCCDCDPTGKCTTRWYPLQGVSYWGNWEDAFTFHHGLGTWRVATFEDDGNWYNFILGGNKISKVPIPDGADPVAAWKKSILYGPPEGVVGEPQEEAALQIYEMRSVNSSFENAVVIGTQVDTRVKLGVFDVWFDYDTVRPDRTPYGTTAIRTAMAAANEIGKWDIKFASSDVDYALGFVEVSTGGYFRCQINQWIGEIPCGSISALNDDSVGTSAWGNVEGVEEAGGGEAICIGIDEVSNYLKVYFGFYECIPADAQSINGIAVTISRRASDAGASANIRDETVRLLVDNTIVGDNKAQTSTNWPTTLNSEIYGGGSDLWGTSVSVPQARFTLGVVLQVEHANNGADAYVDHVSMTVYYTDADGNPQTASTDDLTFYEPGLGVGTDLSGDDDPRLLGSGLITDYLTEPIPFSATGAEVAAIIQPYLDDPYTVSGTGTLGESSNITLTFSHDGSIDSDYAAPGGLANWLVGIAVVHAFPNEAASVHMLNQNGEIQWSRCGRQNARWNGYRDDFSQGMGTITNRRVTRIEVNDLEETLAVYGAGNYPINLFSHGGTPTPSGCYATGIRGWNLIDWEGFGYSQDAESRIITRYGPSGLDAGYTSDWSLALPFTIARAAVADGLVAICGRDPDTNEPKVSVFTTAGVLAWTSDVPSTGPGFSDLNDIWIGINSVILSFGRGAYQFDLITGDLEAYFPHGTTCSSAMIISTDGDDFLVLTGGIAEIAIDPADMDIDPETLT